MSSIPPSSQRNSPPAGVKRDLHSIGNVFTCILEFPLLTIREPQWEMRHAGRGTSNYVEYLRYFDMLLILDCAVIQNRITSRRIKWDQFIDLI